MTEAARLKSTVFVGGFDSTVTMQALHSAFLPFGEIVDVSLPKPDLPSSTDLHRGFGYVEFEHGEDAKEAIDNLDQSELYGKIIKVAPAKPQKEHNEGLGSRIAVWEQEGWLAKNSVEDEEQHLSSRNAASGESAPGDPMQGLEGLDVAGPRQA